MAERQSYHRLGLFVVVSLIILFLLLFVLGGRSLFTPTLKLETYFDTSIAGLDVGAPVKFRGIPLGQVSEIASAASVYQHDVPIGKRTAYIVVRIDMTAGTTDADQLKREVREYVKHGLRAQTLLAGITGQQYLSLDFLDPKENPPLAFPWTPKYPYVPSAPSLTTTIIANAQRFLANLNTANIKGISDNLTQLVETLNQKLDQIPVTELSSQLERILDDTHTLLQHTDQLIATAPIEQAVGNIATASARLDKLLANPAIDQTVVNTAAFTARLKTLATSNSLDRSVENIDRALQRIDALLGDNQYDIRVIIQDLRATADNLRQLSENARRNPAGILIGGPPAKIELPAQEPK